MSSEGFSGVSYDPLLNADLNASVLQRQLPNAKIIIVLRRQSEFCISIWRQLVYKENRFREYISFEKLYGLDGYKAICSIKNLRWDNLVEIYFQEFGKDNVLVLAYEQLRQDPAGFSLKLSEFLSLPPLHVIDLGENVNLFDEKMIYEYPNFIQTIRHILGSMKNSNDGRLGFELNGLLNKVRNLGFSRKYKKPSESYLIKIHHELEIYNQRLSNLVEHDFSQYGYHK